MARTSLRQSDFVRVMRAADRTGSRLQIDMKTLTVLVIPPTEVATLDLPERDSSTPPLGAYAPDGKENFE